MNTKELNFSCKNKLYKVLDRLVIREWNTGRGRWEYYIYIPGMKDWRLAGNQEYQKSECIRIGTLLGNNLTFNR